MLRINFVPSHTDYGVGLLRNEIGTDYWNYREGLLFPVSVSYKWHNQEVRPWSVGKVVLTDHKGHGESSVRRLFRYYKGKSVVD